jgi:hypothetical protein
MIESDLAQDIVELSLSTHAVSPVPSYTKTYGMSILILTTISDVTASLVCGGRWHLFTNESVDINPLASGNKMSYMNLKGLAVISQPM